MTSQFNYAAAARGAILATATQIYLNQGSLANACLFGALANLGIELCHKVSEQMHKIQIYGPEKFDFQILNRLSFEPLKNEEEVKKAGHQNHSTTSSPAIALGYKNRNPVSSRAT